MYCYEGKQIDVWADNDGGLWFYDPDGHVQTVKEDRIEQAIPEGREDTLQDVERTEA